MSFHKTVDDENDVEIDNDESARLCFSSILKGAGSLHKELAVNGFTRKDQEDIEKFLEGGTEGDADSGDEEAEAESFKLDEMDTSGVEHLHISDERENGGKGRDESDDAALNKRLNKQRQCAIASASGGRKVGASGNTYKDEEPKSIMSDIVPVLSRIMDYKLIGSNYRNWSKTVRLFFRSIAKDGHLTDIAPNDETRQTWLRDDAHLLLQIRNSIDSEVIGLINHCEFVKELMDYLDFLYSGKGNLSRMFNVCKAFYRAEIQDQSLTTYFIEFKKTYEELNMLLPFSPDVKVQQQQREQMAIMSFLAGLHPTFETVRSQIISGSDLPSLQEVFSRVLRTERPPPTPTNSILLSRNLYDSGRSNYNKPVRGPRTFDSRPKEPGVIVCHYCYKSGHTKQKCRKLLYKNQKNHSAHVSSSDNFVRIPVNEFAKFSQ